MPLDLLTQTMFSSMNSFLLVAVPLFILVGAVMEKGRVAERMFDFAEALVGWLPGGLGHVNVISSVIFSGVSGSSVADIASVGAIEIKAMERHGFPKGYAVGMTLCTATLSSIIPPSILVVIAGSIANVSIGTLLVAGFVPGLFIAFAFMVFNHFYSVHYGYNPPSPFVLRTVVVTGLRAILPMLTPIILVAGIASGIFTPTEAAAIAVVYVLVLSVLVYRTIPVSEIPEILISTARISGTILFIAATSQLAAWIFAFEGLPDKVAVVLDAVSVGPISGLLVIFVFLLIIGIFMEAIPAMFILIPVLLPPALSLGIDPMHFLVVTVLTLTLGLVTPPVGVCLFAAAQVANMRVEDVIRGSLAPMTVLTIAIFLLVLFPILTLGPIRLLGTLLRKRQMDTRAEISAPGLRGGHGHCGLRQDGSRHPPCRKHVAAHSWRRTCCTVPATSSGCSRGWPRRRTSVALAGSGRGAARTEQMRPVVIACSALRRRYRDFLRERLGQVRYVFLHGSRGHHRRTPCGAARPFRDRIAAGEPACGAGAAQLR